MGFRKHRRLRRTSWISLGFAAALAVTGCNASDGPPATGTVASATGTADIPAVPSGSGPRIWSVDALVFAGDGVWSGEVPAIEDLLISHGVTYQEVNSAQLDAMSLSQLTQFGMFVFPGGEGGTIAGTLSPQTHANLRQAVQQYGVNYVGFCAGSFIAVAPAPVSGQDVSYGLGIVNGPLLTVYTGPGTNASYEITAYSFPDGSKQNVLWYGGPVTPNTGVVARYPTGDPSISEMWSGKGFVVLSGGHPTVTQAILDSLGVTPDAPDQNLAWQLMNAALHQKPLPTF